MQRDITKTITFALLYFAVGFGVSYAFTGSIIIAGGIALIEPLANTVVFYFHERVWRRLEQRKWKKSGAWQWRTA